MAIHALFRQQGRAHDSCAQKSSKSWARTLHVPKGFALLYAAVLLLLLGFSGCAGIGNTQDSGTDLKEVLAWSDSSVLPFSSEVAKGRLDNGLTYLIRNNPYPKDRIQLYLAVKSGSLQEADDQQGLAHFVEHMAFNGTSHFPAGDLVSFLESLGMRFGPEVNAYTSFDRTVYSIELPASKAEVLVKGLTILDDWARNVSMEEKAVEDERTVINEEWRMRQGAGERLQKQQLPVILEGSRYVKRMPIGLPDVFLKATRDQLIKYYRDWYRPDRMAVILVGDLEPGSVQKQITQIFGGAYTNNPAQGEIQTAVPLPRKGHFAYLASQDPELTYTSLQVMYKLPPAPANQRALYREGILWSLAGSMLDARLQKDLTKPDCPYVFARAGMGKYTPDARFLVFTLVPKAGRELDALKVLFQLKASVQAYGFGDDEWQGEKKSMLSFFAQALSQKENTESSQLADELVRHFVEGEVVPGIQWEAQEVKDFLDLAGSVHAAELVRQAWNGDDITFLVSQPEGSANPFGTQAEAQKQIESLKLLAPIREAETSQPTELMTGRPVPGTILNDTFIEDLGVHKWDLSNGMTIYVKTTDFKKDEVILSGLSLGGLSLATDGQFPSARHARAIASYSGLGAFDSPGLDRILKGRNMQVQTRVGDYYSTLDGSSNLADLEGMFQLLNLNFTGIRMDDQAAKAYIESTGTLIANQEKNPEQVFDQTVTYLANGSNPRFAPLTAGDLALIQIQTAREFLDGVYQPQGWVFGIAGSADLSQLKSLVCTYLASIPQTKKPEPFKVPALAARPQGSDVTVKKGTAPKGIGYQLWYVPATYSYQTFVQGKVFNELLDIMLLKRIREELGAVYSIESGFGFNTMPRQEANLAIDFGSDPQKNTLIRSEINKILTSISDGQIDPADLEKARAIVRESYKSDFQKNPVWARTMPQLILIRQQPVNAFLAWEGFLEQVQARDIQKIASWFDPGKVNSFRLEPETP